MLRESLQNFLGRREVIKSLSTAPVDLLVIGGGIHGAAFAHVASLNGYRTVLLEKADYAQGTSSRSSKMLHGGLRYLEHFDFAQVFEGVKAREDLFKEANHICRPTEFLLPVKKQDRWFKFKVGIGLKLYELFLTDRTRKHSWVDSSSAYFDSFGDRRHEYAGGFVYSDGIMDDTRLVIDTLTAARQEGAICLNYVDIESITPNPSGSLTIKWRDNLENIFFGSFEVGGVVNCAGPWIDSVAQNKTLKSLRATFRLSRGTHLLFNKKWTSPSVILPLQEYGRYYFVWPHSAGTLVGTTEREVGSANLDTEPSIGEIQEIISNLAKDLPAAGLNKDSLSYAFAGVRTLPVGSSGKGGNTGKLSRRHKWFFEGGVLSLVGGKFTTAFRTAFEGLKIITKMAELETRPVSVRGRLLPGAGQIEKETAEFRSRAQVAGAPIDLVDRAVSRLGTKVNAFLDPSGDLSWFKSVAGVCLRGEIELALRTEQAETLDDLLSRRLGLEFQPEHGLKGLDEIVAIFKAARPEVDMDAQIAKYSGKIDKINALLNQANS
jgi:glycerol-3-phosphate dehydrogenase